MGEFTWENLVNRRTKKKLFDIFLTITLHPVKVLVIAAITGENTEPN